MLICLAVLLFASHDALSKYLLIFGLTPDSYGLVGIAVICLSGLAVAWAHCKR